MSVLTVTSRGAAGDDGAVVSPLTYGAVLDGVTDDTAAIQAAIDAVEALGVRGLLVFPSGRSCKLSTGLTVDATYVSIDFNRCRIDASSITSGSVITITGSAASGYGLYEQNVAEFSNLILEGNSQTGSVVGLDLVTGASTAGPAGIVFRDVIVKLFGTGEKHGDNTYLIKHYNCSYYDCGTNISIAAGGNKGENILFVGGAHANGGKVLNLADGDAGVTFSGVSMDFMGGDSNPYMTISSGHVTCRDCNIEGVSLTATETFVLTGGTLFIDGGKLIGTAATASPGVFAISAGAVVSCDGVWMYGLRNTNEVLATGAGDIRVSRTRMNATSDLPYVISESQNNSLVKYGFEIAFNEEMAGFFMVGATLESARLTGTNGSASNSAVTARTGSRSLALAQTGNQTARLYIPLKRSVENISLSFFHRDIAASMTGTFDVYFNWVSAQPDEGGIMHTVYSTNPQSLSGVDPGDTWTRAAIRPSLNYVAPLWATHMRLDFNLDALSNGTLYIDDLVVSSW